MTENDAEGRTPPAIQRVTGSVVELPKSRRKVGRPSYLPSAKDRKQVELLSGMGLTGDEIARVIGISAPTVKKYFADELAGGGSIAVAKVAQSLYRMATNPNHPKAAVAAIFFLKARAGWRDMPEPVSKKTQSELDARNAERGTEWESLIGGGAALN